MSCGGTRPAPGCFGWVGGWVGVRSAPPRSVWGLGEGVRSSTHLKNGAICSWVGREILAGGEFSVAGATVGRRGGNWGVGLLSLASLSR